MIHSAMDQFIADMEEETERVLSSLPVAPDQPNTMLSAKAREFVIWREGSAVNWDCTVQELADATGINLSAVRSICDRKGWKCELGLRPGYQSYGTDSILKRGMTDFARGVS